MSVQVICQNWSNHAYAFDISQGESIERVKQIISQREGIPSKLIRLVQANKELHKASTINPLITLQVLIKGGLKGGKGGFGSLLRSMKPKEKQSENFEACRDLSGRRLRNVYNEQRLEEWNKKKSEEDKFIEEETKEYEKTKKDLQAAIHANNFKLDEKYKYEVQNGANIIVESIREIKLNKRNEKG